MESSPKHTSIIIPQLKCERFVMKSELPNLLPPTNKDKHRSRLKGESKEYLKHAADQEVSGNEVDQLSLVFSQDTKKKNRFLKV